MDKKQNNQYSPIFTPRFHLANTSLVGMEVRIKQGQRILPAYDALKLIHSANNKELLGQIKSYFSQWCSKTDSPLYLSWELCSKTKPDELNLFLNVVSSFLPLNRLEIVLDTHDLTANESTKKALELFHGFPERSIRSGLFHSRPLEFDIDAICPNIDLFKLKNGVIKEMKDDLVIASKSFNFIERLNGLNVSIVADDLYSEADVSTSILMGIQYGQGIFLSRNHPRKMVVKPKTLKKIQGSDIYERNLDGFLNLMWT